MLLLSMNEKAQFSNDVIQEIQSQYKVLRNQKMREREHNSEGYSDRNEFHRDYTRILYSSSFRRLQGKMQIFGIESTAFYRNRLTHSLEVAQIAHSIAKIICDQCSTDDEPIYTDEDIFVIDAAALAHDIGHPAFGHKGEKVLDQLSKEDGKRFEGNAQNYRVLRTLEKKEPKIMGLNLTNRTLLAINKYIVEEKTDIKKFMYKNDFEYLSTIREELNIPQRRTLDAQIIELADDIAYSVHDLEDGLAFHYFSIDELLFMINKKDPECCKLLKDIVDKARDYSFESRSYNTSQEYSQVFRKRLTSELTNLFINDVTMSVINDNDAEIHGTSKNQKELQLNQYKDLCRILKGEIFECATKDPEIHLYETKGEIILNSLYKIFSDERINENGKLLPPDYRPRDKYSLKMGTIDYLAGMMDTFAISQYEELCGTPYSGIKIENYVEQSQKKKYNIFRKWLDAIH